MSAAAANKEDEDPNAMLQAKIAQLSSAEGGDEDKKFLARAYKKVSKEVKSSLDALAPEARGEAMNKKLQEQLYQVVKLERENANVKRRAETAQQERDALRGELEKTNALRSKLELLCKELQKQNKLVAAESKRVGEEEDAKRKELSERFSTTIADISEKMEAQGEDRMKQAKENEILREKLTSFAEQIDLRDEQFKHQLHAKDLEKQLEEAKAKHAEEVAKQECAKAAAFEAQCESMAKVEVELRAQLAEYGEKFDSFKDTLTKSNDVFSSFKKETDRMSKRIKELERESVIAKKLAHNRDMQIAQLSLDNKNMNVEKTAAVSAKNKLEKLCRGMQLERNGMREKIRQLTGGPEVEEGDMTLKEDDGQQDADKGKAAAK